MNFKTLATAQPSFDRDAVIDLIRRFGEWDDLDALAPADANPEMGYLVLRPSLPRLVTHTTQGRALLDCPRNNRMPLPEEDIWLPQTDYCTDLAILAALSKADPQLSSQLGMPDFRIGLRLAAGYASQNIWFIKTGQIFEPIEACAHILPIIGRVATAIPKDITNPGVILGSSLDIGDHFMVLTGPNRDMAFSVTPEMHQFYHGPMFVMPYLR